MTDERKNAHPLERLRHAARVLDERLVNGHQDLTDEIDGLRSVLEDIEGRYPARFQHPSQVEALAFEKGRRAQHDEAEAHVKRLMAEEKEPGALSSVGLVIMRALHRAEQGRRMGLGGLDQAVAAAARLAGVSEYHRIDAHRPLPFKLQLLRELMPEMVGVTQGSVAAQWLTQLQAQARAAVSWNDPAHIYSHCLCDPL